MLSVASMTIYKCCDQVSPSVWSKNNYYRNEIPWVDLVIGIILCILGTLAQHGVIPLPDAVAWLHGVGGAQIGVGLFIRCLFPCTTCCSIGCSPIRAFIDNRNAG